MKACIFPGQGAQFVGMGQKLIEENPSNEQILDRANELLGFDIKQIMISGTEEELKQTKVTQPAVFLYAYIKFLNHVNEDSIEAVAGHSLGEITALVANGAISFEDGLSIVSVRAKAMQKACELEESTMAAILGLEDEQVEKVCNKINETVVAANYNCPGQIVVSGSIAGVDAAIEACTEAGARRAIKLNVGGAFHSELMAPAREELAEVIEKINFNDPKIAIYQNVDAAKNTSADKIKANLLMQLTYPVKWTQIMKNMIEDGVNSFVEPGAKVLSGFIRKVDRSLEVENFA